MSIKFPAALKVNGTIIKDHFPEWNNVLKGSRNSNVQSRVQEKVKSLASEVIEATQIQNQSFKPVMESESDSEDDSIDMDASASIQHTPMTPAVHSTGTQPTSTEKVKRPAPSAPRGAPSNNVPRMNPLNLTKTPAVLTTTDPGGSYATDTGTPSHTSLSSVTNV